MEAVRAFNNELSGLYEGKPPISRAKMAQVTKCAIKAIKFYKHVVQSVEKFIQKCKPEYKVPGLYVIDSIVRQSRHQFGQQKDVFAPRFTKNVVATFLNLLKCPDDERSKIVRVLNLWQKNDVFPSEVVQPLLDLAADPTTPATIAAVQETVDRYITQHQKPGPSSQPSQHHQQMPPSGATGNQEAEMMARGNKSQSAADMLATQSDMLNTVTQLLQQTDAGSSSLSAQQQQLQQLQLLQQQLIQQTQLMQQPSQASGPIIDSNLLAQIQTLTNQLLSKTDAKIPEPGGFNTKLLDFDYGESDEEDEKRSAEPSSIQGNVQTILNDPTLMQQIHQMSQTIQKTEQLKSELTMQEQMRQIMLQQQQAEFDQQIGQGPPPQQPPPPHPQPPPHHPPNQHFMPGQPPPPQQVMVPYPPDQMPPDSYQGNMDMQDEDFREHQEIIREDRGDRKDRRSRRSPDRSRSRSPKRRRRSRSRSRDRRRRSRSRDRHKRSRSKDREREKQKEKERERRKKGLPPVRDGHVTVCSNTIWIGHLSKSTTEDELREVVEKYGTVQSISMIPPRGCAYVTLQKRKESNKAVDRLKGFKLNGNALKTAWAQSTGIRESDYGKELWEVDVGAIYIPIESLPADLSQFLEGGIIDEDTLPEHLKGIPTEKVTDTGEDSQDGLQEGSEQNPQSQQINMGQPGLPPQQMGQTVPGMLPQNVPQMPGMMPPQMMMSVPGQLHPGMPRPPMSVSQGVPPQMSGPGILTGSPRPPLPGMPGIQQPGQPNSMLNPMSAASNANPPLPPAVQGLMSATTGMLMNSVGSPAMMARPGFNPAQARFPNFNMNMPPPGFRMPPPGFGSPQRPPLMGPRMSLENPAEAGGMGEPSLPSKPMAWPQNEDKDDEDELNDSDEIENAQGNASVGPVPGGLGGPAGLGGPGPGAPGPPGGPMGFPPGFPQSSQENKPPSLLGGPHPPGQFPGGLPPGMQGANGNQPPRLGGPVPLMGDSRMGGPNMRMGGPPDRFNRPGGPGSMLGGPRGFFSPGGPRFMGNRPGMPPGGPGFPQFSPGFQGGPRPPGIRGPISLLDIEVEAPNLDKGENEPNEEEPFKERENFGGGEEEGGPPPPWGDGEDRWRNRGGDRFGGRDRFRRNQDGGEFDRRDRWRDRGGRDWDRDRDRGEREFDRGDRGDFDRDRENRDRDRDRNNRDRGRDDRNRDRERDRRGGRDFDRKDRDRDTPRQERERTRPSRWSNIEEGDGLESVPLEFLEPPPPPLLLPPNVPETVDTNNVEDKNGDSGEKPATVENHDSGEKPDTVENHDSGEKPDTVENHDNGGSVENTCEGEISENIQPTDNGEVSDERTGDPPPLAEEPPSVAETNGPVSEAEVCQAVTEQSTEEQCTDKQDSSGPPEAPEPVPTVSPPPVVVNPAKIESLKQSEAPPVPVVPAQEAGEATVNSESVELEEGEIAS